MSAYNGWNSCTSTAVGCPAPPHLIFTSISLQEVWQYAPGCSLTFSGLSCDVRMLEGDLLVILPLATWKLVPIGHSLQLLGSGLATAVLPSTSLLERACIVPRLILALQPLHLQPRRGKTVCFANWEKTIRWGDFNPNLETTNANLQNCSAKKYVNSLLQMENYTCNPF